MTLTLISISIILSSTCTFLLRHHIRNMPYIGIIPLSILIIGITCSILYPLSVQQKTLDALTTHCTLCEAYIITHVDDDTKGITLTMKSTSIVTNKERETKKLYIPHIPKQPFTVHEIIVFTEDDLYVSPVDTLNVNETIQLHSLRLIRFTGTTS